MLVVIVVSILGLSLLAVDDAGVVIQLYSIGAQFETYLMISQAKSDWDNHESDPAVIGNCSSDNDSNCLFSGSRSLTVRLQAFLSPSFDQHTVITFTKEEPAFVRKKKNRLTPFFSELWLDNTGVANGNQFLIVCCVTVIRIVARIFATVRCAAAVFRKRWTSLLVVPRGLLEPGLLEAVSSLDHYSQQSCTVYMLPANKEMPAFYRMPRHCMECRTFLGKV
ncbi:hypothetical protein TNCV_920301 [Trichonephila clavipes]|nr:hypothetical protein TNCV_920301 [Trichonephila clavipes]